MGKRNAVRNKSRSTVDNSALVLRGPTSPPTAGRKPAASPPSTSGVDVAIDLGVDVAVDLGVDVAAGVSRSSQLKSWAVGVDVAVAAGVATQNSSTNALSACPPTLFSDSDIRGLRSFFELLDKWDRRRVE